MEGRFIASRSKRQLYTDSARHGALCRSVHKKRKSEGATCVSNSRALPLLDQRLYFHLHRKVLEYRVVRGSTQFATFGEGITENRRSDTHILQTCFIASLQVISSNFNFSISVFAPYQNETNKDTENQGVLFVAANSIAIHGGISMGIVQNEHGFHHERHLRRLDHFGSRKSPPRAKQTASFLGGQHQLRE